MRKTLRWLQLHQSDEQSNETSFRANAIFAKDKPETSIPRQDRSTSHQRTKRDSPLDTLPTGATATSMPATREKVVRQFTNSFELLPDGAHRHYHKDKNRQQKLSTVISNLFGRKKEEPHYQDEDPALSPTRNLHDQSKTERERVGATTEANISPVASLEEKYGVRGEVIGRGASGLVRLSHKAATGTIKPEQLYAVKEFRRPPRISMQTYHERLTSEFYIASALQHPNVICILDLLQDAAGNYCQVMEYCSGGDLNTLIITSGHLEAPEADCYFKQLMYGVNYLHEMGVAHRDLKPDNLLLTTHGAVKITDFGHAECFRLAWENEASMTLSHCGTAPFDAPEEYSEAEFDPRAVDVWATGVIYMAMRTGELLWVIPQKHQDSDYKQYLEDRKHEEGYWPIERLRTTSCLNVIYSILDPNPSRRITASQILRSEWVQRSSVCEAGERGW